MVRLFLIIIMLFWDPEKIVLYEENIYTYKC